MQDWQHIIKHGELRQKQELVRAVIEHPDSIYQDTDNKKKRVLYKSCVLAPPWGACYVRVIIEYHMIPLIKKGWVCTAHASYNKKAGEVLIWSK